MRYYYVAVIGGEIFFSSPSLERVIEKLEEEEEINPFYMKNNKVQIFCYEARGEILEWKDKITERPLNAIK